MTSTVLVCHSVSEASLCATMNLYKSGQAIKFQLEISKSNEIASFSRQVTNEAYSTSNSVVIDLL